MEDASKLSKKNQKLNSQSLNFGKVKAVLTTTFARVRATLIRCQSPRSEEEQSLGFSLDLTNDNSMQSLSRPYTTMEKKDLRKL